MKITKEMLAALSEETNEEDTNKEEVEYRILKLRLEELQKGKKKRYSLFSGIATTLLVGVFLGLMTVNYRLSTTNIIYLIVMGILSGIFVAIYVYMLLEIRESKFRRRMLEYETENIQEDVQEDVFENSIKMSYKYLDQYYLQTREQAQKGFFVTVFVSIFGASLLAGGIVAMFLEKTEPSYVACASGVITEFVAAIFFYLYNKTIASMSKYHNKLVLSQNISIAMKVADTLPSDDKTKSKNLIISELIKDINTYLIKSDSEDDDKTQKNSKEI